MVHDTPDYCPDPSKSLPFAPLMFRCFVFSVQTRKNACNSGGCDSSSAPKSSKPVSFLAPATSPEEEIGRTAEPSVMERNTAAAAGATPYVAASPLL
ncbi:hypothetical protein U1Q18_028293 [Sarracenia purpurea var. burkii]